MRGVNQLVERFLKSAVTLVNEISPRFEFSAAFFFATPATLGVLPHFNDQCENETCLFRRPSQKQRGVCSRRAVVSLQEPVCRERV